MTRVGLVATLLGGWCGVFALFGTLKALRRTWLAISLIAVVALLFPGRRDDAAALRREYTRSLREYERVPFVWGGESRRGVDCSGLMRCGLVDAHVRRAVATRNPGLLRAAVSLWWHDTSAMALRDGYRNNTRVLLWAPSINELDHTKIQPGDLAVMENGIHVMAYLGESTWIEADPDAGQVIKVAIPNRERPWFNIPVHLLRWRQFENE